MRLKVLGTGSHGNCYVFKPEKGKALIIDCGINFKEVKKEISFNPALVCGALLDHSHGDHSKYVGDFLKAGINVYMATETKKELGISSHRAKEIESMKTFCVGDFKVMPFELKHDVFCIGFLIQHEECGRVLFLTDTVYSPYTFKNLNNILIEANYAPEIAREKLGDKKFLYDRVIQSHMSLDTCIEFLKANDLSQVNNIVLIHLSDGNSDEVLFREEVTKATGKTVTVANNGLQMELNKYPF
ncbi:MBL fold metallo-hydrolase [Salinimicrobium sp. GXAS 041]|uniref:MBL fold metallo-hydrolase n=1 Tax=Salinimicrobium sp. GXAS 041 TaxID=3400806 RepID=UPI003C7461BF